MATRATRTSSRSPKSITHDTAEQIALAAARQALTEYANSPDRLASMQATVKTATEEAIKSTLEQLGIDTLHPEETRKDMVHLRTWRELMDFIRTQGIGAATRYIVIGVLAALALGIAVMFHRA